MIISDLHLGPGGPYEIFAGTEALPAFLDQTCQEPTRVLVNGDGFDFLLEPSPGVGPEGALANPHGGYTEDSGATAPPRWGRENRTGRPGGPSPGGATGRAPGAWNRLTSAACCERIGVNR